MTGFQHSFRLATIAAALIAALTIFGAASAAATETATAAVAGDVRLLDVRFGVHSTEKTRVVFDLTAAPDYRIFTLDGDAKRVVLDFGRLDFALDAAADAGSGSGRGAVAQYRYAHNAPGASRVVLDLKTAIEVEQAFLIEPSGDVAHWRLVLDLTTADDGAFASNSGFVADRLGLVRPNEPVAETERRIIVIDPGHGGHDPGAIGQNKTREKNVVLPAAHALREKLEASGDYIVKMTRDGDTYVDHEGRTRFAREAGADLFISLHADALEDRRVSGGSVYTLSESASARYARNVRRGGDRVFDIETESEAVDDILLALAQRETKNQSGIFAQELIKEIDGVIPLLNNSHRRGGYLVLLAPDVPAVLLELAFISNAGDEANLNSAEWRDNTMSAVARAIDNYFEARGSRHATVMD